MIIRLEGCRGKAKNVHLDSYFVNASDARVCSGKAGKLNFVRRKLQKKKGNIINNRGGTKKSNPDILQFFAPDI